MEKERDKYVLLYQKIRRVMKITTIFLLVGILQLSATTYAQEQRISVTLNNGTFYDLVSQIEKQSEFMFFYKSEEIDSNQRFNLKADNKEISEILNEVTKKNNLSYAITGKHIIITKITGVSQQSRKITGVVLDEAGEPIIGANVIEKGTTNGVMTDINGTFSLEVKRGSILQVSYIGYKPIEVSSGLTPFKVILEEDNQQIEEVVVVGYGTQKKINLTGAVSNVKADMLENRTSSSPINLLTGQVPGMTIIQRSGQPGADMGTLRVRGIGTLGNAEAMVVIDGVESSFNNVSPDDIESISVLKDAAASSIYGVRAANGVILITTKKGVVGKPVVSYNGYVGWQSACRMPDYLDSYHYAQLFNEAYANDGLPAPYSEQDLQKFKDGSDPDHYPNSNWLNTC